MSSNIEIELLSSGIQSLMKSDDVMKELQTRADNIVKKCPNGNYETSQYVGRNRANVSIYTTDSATYFRNLENNELLKALR